MSRFKPKLSRHESCAQVMPVPVLPVWILDAEKPKPIYQLNEPLFPYHQDKCEPTIVPIEFYAYPPPSVPPVGTFLQNETGSTPSDYFLCDGKAISRTMYANLFYAIGTYYGAGDNFNTFNLPNLTNTMNPNITYIIKH